MDLGKKIKSPFPKYQEGVCLLYEESPISHSDIDARICSFDKVIILQKTLTYLGFH
jgi:hypothetical protein